MTTYHASPRHWVQSPWELESFMERAQECSRIGLDVETRIPSQELCLIQIATDHETAVIDALALGDLSSLSALLLNPSVEKVIHNASFEKRILGKHGLEIDPIFDTLSASRARYRGQKPVGGHKLGSVCLRELGLTLDKRAQCSDWSRRPLSMWQLEYAALDAEVLLGLHDVFK